MTPNRRTGIATAMGAGWLARSVRRAPTRRRSEAKAHGFWTPCDRLRSPCSSPMLTTHGGVETPAPRGGKVSDASCRKAPEGPSAYSQGREPLGAEGAAGRQEPRRGGRRLGAGTTHWVQAPCDRLRSPCSPPLLTTRGGVETPAPRGGNRWSRLSQPSRSVRTDRHRAHVNPSDNRKAVNRHVSGCYDQSRLYVSRPRRSRQ